MKRISGLVSIFLLLGAAQVLAEGAGLAKVSFLPQWSPQSQFAGYYVAYEKGLYRQHGLEVHILRGGPTRPPSEWLETGQADFGTLFLTTGIVRRARGAGLINIAQIVQRSALMLVAKQAGGIIKPEDINGKKVGLWGEEFQGQPRAFFQKYGLKVTVIPQSATLNLFLRGGVDVASAMWYNEYHLLLSAGLNPEELTTFLMADYGFNFPEDGIYCREETWQSRPEVCRRFVQASIAGWNYAFAHPDEALDIVMKYVAAAHVATNREHQKWMLARMQDIIRPPGWDAPLGGLSPETYQQVAAALQQNRAIQDIPRFSRFFRDLAAAHEE